MEHTFQTSPFYPAWVETTEADAKKMETYIANGDFEKIGELTEFSAMKMHATTLSANPPFTYFEPESLVAQNIVRNLRAQNIPAYFTMDAGPNVKILTRKKYFEPIKQELLAHFPEEKIIFSGVGQGVEILEKRVAHD
jgi:diphosphomevalonate decarboxylase